MRTYLIGYDLNKSDKDYPKLIEAIKSIGTWWHELDSTWIVKTNMTSVQIRDTLQAKIDNNDELFVARLQGEAAWVGFKTEASNWLLNNMSFE